MQQKLKFRLFALLSFLYSFSLSQEFPVSDYTGDGIVDTIVRSKSLQFPETQIDFVMKSTHKNAQKVLFRNVGHWECYTLSLRKIRHLTHLGLPILHFNCGSEENASYYLLQESENFQPYFLGYFFEEYSFDEYGVFQNLNPPQKVLSNVFNIKEDSTWNFYWTLPGKTLLYNKPEKSATNDRVESEVAKLCVNILKNFVHLLFGTKMYSSIRE